MFRPSTPLVSSFALVAATTLALTAQSKDGTAKKPGLGGITKGDALQVHESGIFSQRGKCVKIGDGSVYLSGQIGPPAFTVTREKGIKTLINVRMKRELQGLGYEADLIAEEEGLKYHHIEIGPMNVVDGRADKFLKILKESEKPVLVYGSNGNRVWGLWAFVVGSEFGIPVDETKKVAAKLGVKKLVIEDFVRQKVGKSKSDQ